MRARITQKIGSRYRIVTAIMLCWMPCSVAVAAAQTPREQFVEAWTAASKGDHSVFARLPQELAQYQLYPYLVYEDLRYRRARVDPGVIADFLDRHSGWAFTDGLRHAWLLTLGKRGKWTDLLKHAEGSLSTELRCYRARAQIETGQLDGLLAEAQSLWLSGKSQPDECDPVFSWLDSNGGITADLAWQRVRLAMLAGNPRFTLYLARFIPPKDRPWLERWQDVERRGYRNLGQARNWPDRELTRMITEVSLQRLARRDPERAWGTYRQIEGNYSWPEVSRGAILHEIALQSAVDLNGSTLEVMAAVPPDYRDDQLLQWWARKALITADWNTLLSVIEQMSAETRLDGRWRYWKATALEKTGETASAQAIFGELSLESSYYGFLAADRLASPYVICPLNPSISQQSIDRMRLQADFSRSLELRQAGLQNWALAEWSLATARLDKDGLRTAAGLARSEAWHDRVIFALGDSGDRRFYEWRFPMPWTQHVLAESRQNRLDSSWIFGVMRSESALAETARSSAGALGLMQITPATASRLARSHGLAYRGREQLKDASLNIRFGTRFMRELMDRYDQNPVLVSGAYNAGPQAVDRWLDARPRGEAAVWIESIPYFETRDYIPRVLAFTAIYDWRMNNPVTRLSSRMPALDSSKIKARETTEVVCLAPG